MSACFFSVVYTFVTQLCLFSLPSDSPLFPSMSFVYVLVVYEHRSRLEKSLQKERLEHKKAKEGEKNNTYTLSLEV